MMVKLQALGLLLGPKQHKGLPMFSASLGPPPPSLPRRQTSPGRASLHGAPSHPWARGPSP